MLWYCYSSIIDGSLAVSNRGEIDTLALEQTAPVADAGSTPNCWCESAMSLTFADATNNNQHLDLIPPMMMRMMPREQ